MQRQQGRVTRRTLSAVARAEDIHGEWLADRVRDLDELHEPLDDFDTTAEVDATFRTQRRVALGYFAVFLAVTLAVPTLSLVLGWWSEGRIAGMSPNFLMAAGGLYLMFFVVALAASSLADAVEDRMLGGGDEHLDALPDAFPGLGSLPESRPATGANEPAGPDEDRSPELELPSSEA